jgi:hypothetical protein
MSSAQPAKNRRGYEGMFLTCFGCSGQKYALIPDQLAPPNGSTFNRIPTFSHKTYRN